MPSEQNEMVLVLRVVAWECQRAVSNDAIYRAANKMCKEPFISLHIERVLRESGLLRLLETYQAYVNGEPGVGRKQVDAALAAVKEKAHA